MVHAIKNRICALFIGLLVMVVVTLSAELRRKSKCLTPYLMGWPKTNVLIIKGDRAASLMRGFIPRASG